VDTVTSAPVRVAIVDDHTLFREGVRLILELEPDLAYVGAASTVEDALALIRRERPALVLLDLRLSSERGIDLLSEIATWRVAPRVLVVTAFPEEGDIAEALRLGAQGIVLKDATRDTLVAAVRAVSAGRHWLPPELGVKVIAGLRSSAGTSITDRLEQLTARERDIARLVGEGLKNRDIAMRLGVAEKTIKGHLTNIFLKLGVKDRLELALLAVKTRLCARPER